jgi:hypothetical protein
LLPENYRRFLPDGFVGVPLAWRGMNAPSLPATLGRATTLDAGLLGCGGRGLDADGFGGAARSGFMTRGAGGLGGFGGSGNPPTLRASVGRGAVFDLGGSPFRCGVIACPQPM